MRSWKRSWKAHNVRGAHTAVQKKYKYTLHTREASMSLVGRSCLLDPTYQCYMEEKAGRRTRCRNCEGAPGVLHPLRTTACCSAALLFKRTTNTNVAKPSPRLCFPLLAIKESQWQWREWVGTHRALGQPYQGRHRRRLRLRRRRRFAAPTRREVARR
jgi:hypothetical protein